MIFINGDTIVDIKEGKPFDETTILPHQECDGNLEVNKGFCVENNIQIGDKVYKT